jgi:hypothetical protein
VLHVIFTIVQKVVRPTCFVIRTLGVPYLSAAQIESRHDARFPLDQSTPHRNIDVVLSSSTSRCEENNGVSSRSDICILKFRSRFLVLRVASRFVLNISRRCLNFKVYTGLNGIKLVVNGK